MSKTVVITGGSSGIGKATAELFAKKGFVVYEISRSGQSTDKITHITADVTDEESVKNAFEKISKHTDKLDVLVNNAGYGISGPVEDTPCEQAKNQFDVNFFGTMRATNAAMPYVKNAKGIIINVSSVAGALPIPFQAFYSASKSAINSLTCSLANELKPYGVRVAAVMPGDTKTSFTERRVKLSSDEYKERLDKSISTMEKDELSGCDPMDIAKVIFSVSQRKNPKPLVTAGSKYKLLMLLSKLLPIKVVNKILGSLYAK